MAATLTALAGTISTSVSLTAKQTETDGTIEQAPVSHSSAQAITFGTGAGKANELYATLLTIAGGGNTSLDLQALAATLGRTASLDVFKGIQIINTSTVADCILSVGASGGNEFSAWVGATGDILKIPAGWSFLLAGADASGLTVDATHKVLKIANAGAGSATLKIVIYGESS